jgi:hypothetical protein
MIKIYKWLVDFNPQQTKCMLFSTNQGNIKPQILFNNEDVEFVVNHKTILAASCCICSILFKSKIVQPYTLIMALYK